MSSESLNRLPAHPEELPELFVRAWNARDPEGLARLFDEDAEFVNVTGLWWHDREAIKRAHAYGLERIFDQSVLEVLKKRVKHLAPNIAVVHARMRLSGQRPIGEISTTRTRQTIFSFVVHRTADEWSCASAQNTDVVPGAETNIIDAEGRFRAVSYRESNPKHSQGSS